ncbi:hypothetical protein AAHC03_026202 [Spirometra sp. Aus1]
MRSSEPLRVNGFGNPIRFVKLEGPLQVSVIARASVKALKAFKVDFKADEMACDKKIAAKMCEQALYVMSYLLFVLFLPVSVFICLKVVQEYERAVIFRLGRVMDGSMKGPGIFLCLPCVEEFFPCGSSHDNVRCSSSRDSDKGFRHRLG